MKKIIVGLLIVFFAIPMVSFGVSDDIGLLERLSSLNDVLYSFLASFNIPNYW